MTMNSCHVLSRRIVAALLASVVGISALEAQTARAPASSSSSTKDDQPVQLEAFEVIMTQDKGYHSPYSGNALRTNEEIMKVPQSITVLTRDMIDDIASPSAASIVAISGAALSMRSIAALSTSPPSGALKTWS